MKSYLKAVVTATAIHFTSMLLFAFEGVRFTTPEAMIWGLLIWLAVRLEQHVS